MNKNSFACALMVMNVTTQWFFKQSPLLTFGESSGEMPEYSGRMLNNLQVAHTKFQKFQDENPGTLNILGIMITAGSPKLIEEMKRLARMAMGEGVVLEDYLLYMEVQNTFLFGTVEGVQPTEQQLRERLLYLRWWEEKNLVVKD